MSELSPFMGLGTQLVITVCIFGAIGWWIDKRYDTSPIWMVAFLLFGIIGSVVKFVYAVLRLKTGKKAN